MEWRGQYKKVVLSGASLTRNFDFSSSHIKKSKKKKKPSEINFSNTFYWTQYMQNSLISTYNQCKRIINGILLHSVISYTKAMESALYVTPVVHLNLGSV